MKTITIIGFGRFGQTLYRLLKDDFEVRILNRSPITPEHIDAKAHAARTIQEAYESDVIFFAVPIRSFERILREHKKYFRDRHLLIDVLSVKMHASAMFTKFLKTSGARALLTHPMFGPDSTTSGFNGLPLIISRHSATNHEYDFWGNYFKSKGIRVIELSARDHDRLAADSQGLTHFVGRLLAVFGMKETQIDSLGTKKLLGIKAQTCNDSWELFTDLQTYNPFTKDMRLRLARAYEKINVKLIPKKVKKNHITYGIQGGKGSFNDEAIVSFLKEQGIKNAIIKYLSTSRRVMHALESGSIDIGQMAIHNSVGGVVDESLIALAKSKVKITNQFEVRIAHALMIRPDATLADITDIMSHPQVFAQCRNTLARLFPKLKLISGKGDLIDHANVAKHLGEKKLSKNIAVMGSKRLAALHNLVVVRDNLQDSANNVTGFIHICRI